MCLRRGKRGNDSPYVHVFMLCGLVVLLALVQLSNRWRWGQCLHPGQRRGLDSLTHGLLLGLTYKTNKRHKHSESFEVELIHREYNLTHTQEARGLKFDF